MFCWLFVSVTQKAVSTYVHDEDDVDVPVFPNLQLGSASGSILPGV